MVNDILDFSMMESGEIKLSATPISLPELVGSVADILSGIAQQKGIELRLELQQGLPEFVTGDEKRLRQVLLNLAGNAVKFTDTGFASIRVDCESVSDQHVRVRFLSRIAALAFYHRANPVCSSSSVKLTDPSHGGLAGRDWALSSANRS